MKKYISAILIPCLLLQFIGCYSSKEISLEELKNTDDAILTTKDSTIYYLNENVSIGKMLYEPEVYFATDWIVKQDSKRVILITNKATRVIEGSSPSIINKDTANINYKDIKNITVETLETGNTILAVVSILVGILGIAFAVFALSLATNNCEGGIFILAVEDKSGL